jgi:hypothetical protein
MPSLPLSAASFVGRQAARASAIRGETDRYETWVEHVS